MRRTALISERLATLALLAAAACAPPPAPPTPEDARREIVRMLEASADAWNRGDLDGYLGYYAEAATFVGASGLIQGREEIRRRYLQSYWSSGTPADHLAFEVIDVRVTGPDTATLVGRYRLQDRTTGQESGTGLFTLLLARNNDAWEILHDHSSADGG